MIKGLFTKRVALLVLIGLLSLSLGACWKSNLSGNSYVEPEITVNYLITEFADQITRDGAEKKFGVIDSVHDNKDGTYTLTVLGKQFVNDNNQPNGFYIADRNIDYSLTLSQSARSVIFANSDPESGKFFLTSEEFINAFNESFATFDKEASEDKEYYFYFYVMHDFVELIVQQYTP